MRNTSKLLIALLLMSLIMAACRQAPNEENNGANDPQPTEAADEPNDTADNSDDGVSAEDITDDVGTIKIGFMGPLTGGAAFIGIEQLGFAEAAVQIFNERTGLNVEIVEGDTEINPDTGRIVAEQFAADSEIIGVVGPAGSQVCEAVKPIFAEAGLVHITPSCTTTALTAPENATDTFYRPIPTDADQSTTDAGYMVDVLGATYVFLVDDQSSYSVGLNDEMEALLVEAGVDVERASVTQEETDFSSIVTSVLAAGADVVFFPSQIESQIATLAVQLREQGYDGVFFLADGGFTFGWIATASEASEGTYVSFFSPDPNLVPEAAPYNAIYAANYSEDFGAFGGASGFVTQILLEAIGRCAAADDVSRECVNAEMDATDMASTMLGIPVSFDENNQAAGSAFFLFQVQDGAFVLLAGDDAGMVTEPGPVTDVTIKLGFMGPLTGGAAFIGQEQLGFVAVTVQLFNERTGLNVEIVEGDTEINPDTGRIVAEQFAADEDIYVIVGPAGSQVCESTQPVFEEAGLAHITPSCTGTSLTDPGTATFFRPIPTDADQSSTIVNYMIDDLGISSAFLVDDQSSYSVGLNDEVEGKLSEAGITDIDRASVTQEETDFSSIATAVVAGGFEVVLFPSQIESQMATLAVQLREQGYDGVFFLADGGFAFGWVDTAGAAAEGAYVTFFSPDPNLVPAMAPYNGLYVEQYAPEFGAFGGAAGHVAFIALDAIETCANAGDISRACIVDALGNMNLETPLGITVAFGEGNQIAGSAFFLFQVQDGAFVLLED